MKARTRKRQLLPLQRESSRLGRAGKDARFYGGSKWTRRQMLVMWPRLPGKATILTRIRCVGVDMGTPSDRTIHATEDPEVFRVVDTYKAAP